MFFFTNQNTIIRRLNSYAQYHNLPIRFNERGMCNGFCNVYAKYLIQGKQKDFYRTLRYISETPTSELTHECQLFALQILLTSSPEDFNKKLSQGNAYQALSIDKQPLKKAFSLGMVTNDQNWEKIIQDLEIAEAEVLLVKGKNHIVAVSMLNGKYEIYDPNDFFKYSIVDNAQQLLAKLRPLIFMIDGALGLNVQLLQHPNSTRQLKFNEKDIIRAFITPENVNEKSTGDGFTTLDITLLKSDPIDVDLINMLLDHGAKNSRDIGIIISGLIFTNVSLPVLNRVIELAEVSLIKSKDNNETAAFNTLRLHMCLHIRGALERGREEIFNLLYDHPTYNACLVAEQFPCKKFIFSALLGGREALLRKMIKEYKEKTTDTDKSIAKFMNNLEMDLIEKSIAGGSPTCLTLILDELQKENYDLNDEQKLRYLSKAIHANNFHMVRILVGIMPPARLQSLNLPLSIVEQTTLAVLKLLKCSGVHFSENAQHVITRKETQSIGIVSWLLIIIEKIRDYLLNNKTIYYDTKLLPASDGAVGEEQRDFSQPPTSPLVEQSFFQNANASFAARHEKMKAGRTERASTYVEQNLFGHIIVT